MSKENNKETEDIQNLRKFKEEVENGDLSQDSISSSSNSETPEVIFNTHKFLYSLYHNGQIKGHEIEFSNRDGELQKITLEKIEIGASPVSARFYDVNENRHLIPFLRIQKVFREGQLVWEGEDTSGNAKIIKGI